VTEIADPRTGEMVEVTPAQGEVLAMLALPADLYGAPVTAEVIDGAVLELDVLLNQVARVVAQLYEERQTAEDTLTLAVATAMSEHEALGAQLARQRANLATADERAAVSLAKSKLRYAEELQKSLQNRSFGLMNIGKRMQSQMGFGPR